MILRAGNRSKRMQVVVAMCSVLAVLQSTVDLEGCPDLAAVAASTRAAEPNRARRPLETAAVPDIFGPGKVLTVGRVHMKVTNFGVNGNPFTNTSSDPSGQWPGASGVEYLNSIALAVAAKDPTAVPPTAAHRVSYFTEWRPPTLDAEDRIYATYQGAANGVRFVNDDNDYDPLTLAPRIDEDFLDGRDNDGDGLIDEDHGAHGWQEFSLVMRDDTQEAMNADPTHVPLAIECRQQAWAYGWAGMNDFNVIEYTFINRSGHTLDSMYVGWRVDMDAGPISNSGYFLEDLDLPGFPSGEFPIRVGAQVGDLLDSNRRQRPHSPGVSPPVAADSALCPRLKLRVNGFAIADGDGDGGVTTGIPAFLLVTHTTDPLGQRAPSRVGFRAFRSFPGGTPFDHGGNPTNDDQRYAFMSSTENIDPATGFIDAIPEESLADMVEWCSIGPFRNVPAGGSVQATIAFAVAPGNAADAADYAQDYQDYAQGVLPVTALLTKYPLLVQALGTQMLYEGQHYFVEGYPVPSFHGRETLVQLNPGDPPVFLADCHDVANGNARLVTDHQPQWFDFDCDYCTGVWDSPSNRGLFHKTWNTAAPPVAVEGHVPDAARLTVTPNPARDLAGVNFEMVSEGEVRMTVHDLAGRKVRDLRTGPLGAGRHTVRWDLRDQRAHRVRPGLYLCKVWLGAAEYAASVLVVE